MSSGRRGSVAKGVARICRGRDAGGARCPLWCLVGRCALRGGGVALCVRPGRRVVVLPRRAGCREIASYRGPKSRMAAFGFGPHGVDDTVQVLLVESHAEGGPFSVRDFETTLNEAHAATLRSAYDGENQWLDFHTLSRARASPWPSSTARRARRDRALCGRRHRRDQRKRRRRGNLYVVTPNGVSVRSSRPTAPAGSPRYRPNVAGYPARPARRGWTPVFRPGFYPPGSPPP